MKTEIFDIKGMSCSACVAHVDKSVRNLDGIIAVQVNLLTNSMSVRYDEAVMSNTDIESAVKKAGYEASTRVKIETEGQTIAKKSGNGNELKVDKETINMKKRWQRSLFFLIPLLYVSMGDMLALPYPAVLKGHANALNFAFIQFLLALPIYLINRKYFITGFRSLMRLAPNMDSLIAIGSSAAMFYGIYVIFRIGYGMGSTHDTNIMKFAHDIYFESGATILTLITLGKYFEARSKSRTSEALTKLMDLSPKTALVIRDDKETEVPVCQVVIGDLVIIKSGQSVPVDGEVMAGNASLDESALTGESIPVFKKEGDTVMSATICQTGYLTLKATKVGEDTTLSQIIRLVEEASASKAPIAKLADKISGFFVPVVIAIALVASAVWLLLG